MTAAEADITGKRIRVRFDNADQDFYYTILNVVENTDSMLLFLDRDRKLRGINKKYIKELS